MKVTRALMLAVLLVASESTWAQADLRDDFRLPSPRAAALGGFHTTDAEDITVLFANPAGLVATESQFSFSSAGVLLSGPVFTLSSAVIEGVDGGFESLFTSDTVISLLRSLYASGEVIGPLYFSYVGEGLGFGVFNATSFEARTVGSTSVRASVAERLILHGGYAFAVPLPRSWRGSLSLGVLLKGLVKGQAGLGLSILELADVDGLLGDDPLAAIPLSIVSGIGMDVGIRYSLDERLVVGLAGRDVYSPTVETEYASVNAFLENQPGIGVTYGYVPFDLSAGVQWRPRLGPLERVVDDLALLLDYGDIFDFLIQSDATPNPLLKVGVGVELTVLDIMSIRGGFTEGLFGAGLGLDLTLMELDFAMFGSELSLEPGLRPVFNVILGLTFGL